MRTPRTSSDVTDSPDKGEGRQHLSCRRGAPHFTNGEAMFLDINFAIDFGKKRPTETMERDSAVDSMIVHAEDSTTPELPVGFRPNIE